jgi:transposase-like protein
MTGFLRLDELFEGRHFDREVIALCVRWYLHFELSFRDLVEMMAERGLSIAHRTNMRWVHHYALEFERRWRRLARPCGRSWRVDETYVKIRGRWVYLYRAVEHAVTTVFGSFRSTARCFQTSCDGQPVAQRILAIHRGRPRPTAMPRSARVPTFFVT